jgi:hypothetical protein
VVSMTLSEWQWFLSDSPVNLPPDFESESSEKLFSQLKVL